MTNYQKIKSSKTNINTVYKLLDENFALNCRACLNSNLKHVTAIEQHGSAYHEFKKWLKAKPGKEQITNYKKLKTLNCHEMAEYMNENFGIPCYNNPNICPYDIHATCDAPDGYECIETIEKWLNAESEGD